MTQTFQQQRFSSDHATRSPAGERFVALDGVRGVAAMMVLILHSAMVFPNAFLAVDLFFMLSGFVLAHGYGDRIGDGEGRKRFVIARLIRLYPLYLAGCLIALPVAIGIAIYGWSYFTLPVVALAAITAPFFIILPYDGYTIPLNPPGWSLTFELIANALFLLVGTKPGRVVPVLLISAPLLLLGMHLYDGGTTGWHSFWGAFPRTFFSFFMGVLLYRLWRDGRLPRLAVPILLILALVVAMCVLQPAHYRNYQALAVFVINPAIIWLGACCTVRGVTAKACEYLGMLSYGVYVVHVPIIMWVEGVRFLAISASAQEYIPTGATAWASIPISLAVAHYLSVRFDISARRRLVARFLTRSHASAPALQGNPA